METTYVLNEEEKKTLETLLQEQKGANIAFSTACQEFAQIQTQILIEKDAFWMGIAQKMGIDYKKVHASGKRMKSVDGVVTIIDAPKPAQPAKAEGDK